MTATGDITRRKRPAQTGELIGVRLQPEQLDALDAWIERHPEANLTRPEAIKRLLAGALATDRPSTILPNFTTGRDIV
jgi:hypothetical protein